MHVAASLIIIVISIINMNTLIISIMSDHDYCHFPQTSGSRAKPGRRHGSGLSLSFSVIYIFHVTCIYTYIYIYIYI